MNLWLVFFKRLGVGGLACLAVQGGLLASVIAAREDEETSDIKKHAIYATIAFLISKLIAYTILGFLLGAFGGAVNISGSVQTFMQLFAGIYMIAIALNLLDVHPIFRYAIIQPPRFLTKMIRKRSKSKDIFAPTILGAMTIFIPCGATLAMEALAISSADAITGASIMAAFTLGTMPLFFGIGFVTSVLGEAFKARFLKIAAVLVIYLGVTSINGSLIVLNFPLNSQSISEVILIQNEKAYTESAYDPVANTQIAKIDINSTGYTPDYIRVKKGVPLTLKLKTADVYSCTSTFMIPALGISKELQSNDTYEITFTPEQYGKLTFSCSAGIYTGIIEVI